MEPFAKIVDGFYPLAIFTKSSIKNVCQGSKNTSQKKPSADVFQKSILKSISQYSQENICVGEHDAIAICVGLSF